MTYRVTFIFKPGTKHKGDPVLEAFSYIKAKTWKQAFNKAVKQIEKQGLSMKDVYNPIVEEAGGGPHFVYGRHR
jgi:hypothetical protein